MEDQTEILENLLVKSRPVVLSKLERKVLKSICKKGLPDKYRKHLWLRASGASSVMTLPENISYYKNLKRTPMDYPNPSF